MTIRSTSISAYNEIKENGLLSKRRMQVYEALVECGPATGGEVFRAMKIKFGIGSLPTNSNTTTRLGELREMGVAEEIGRRECRVTNQTVILWRAVDALPRKLIKKPRTECPHCKGTGKING